MHTIPRTRLSRPTPFLSSLPRRRFLAQAGTLLLTAPSIVSAATDGSTQIKIGGTGSGLGIMRRLSDQFGNETGGNRPIRLLPSLGSGGGIKALKAGVLEIAIISRPLEAGESTDDLIVKPLGVTALGFAARANIPLKSLTLDQVAALYANPDAELVPGTRVRLVLRHQADIDTQLPSRLSPALAEAMKKAASRMGMILAPTDQDAADAIERLPGAFGVSSLCLVRTENRKIDFIATNGVAPSIESMESGAYPLTKPLALVLRRDAADGHLSPLLRFLQTPAALKTLRDGGILPS